MLEYSRKAGSTSWPAVITWFVELPSMTITSWEWYIFIPANTQRNKHVIIWRFDVIITYLLRFCVCRGTVHIFRVLTSTNLAPIVWHTTVEGLFFVVTIRLWCYIQFELHIRNESKFRQGHKIMGKEKIALACHWWTLAKNVSGHEMCFWYYRWVHTLFMQVYPYI